MWDTCHVLLSCVVDGEGVATHVLPCSCPIIYHGRCADAGLWARRPSSPMPGSSTSGGQAPVEFEQYIHLTHIAGCFVWSSVAPSRNGVKSFMAGPVWKSIWLRHRTANFICLQKAENIARTTPHGTRYGNASMTQTTVAGASCMV